MKQLLLHGPAIKVSRIKLQELRGKFNKDNILVFESGADTKEILINLQSMVLFEGERLVIVENPPDIVFDFPLSPFPLTLVLWFDHEVDVKKWPGFEVLFFPESREVSVFPFLDMLTAGDKRAFIEIKKLKQAAVPAGRQGFDIFYLIVMVYYLLRSSIMKKRTKFSLDEIKNFYREILEIEFKLKSGYLEKPQAEFTLVNKFLKIV